MKSTRPRGRPMTVIRWPSLVEMMAEAGMNDKQLAEKIGISWRQVGCWRRGEYAPWDNDIPLIADALGGRPERLRADVPIKRSSHLSCNAGQNAKKAV